MQQYIGFQFTAADYFADSSLAGPAVQFHLPQTILGMGIALSEKQILYV